MDIVYLLGLQDSVYYVFGTSGFICMLEYFDICRTF